MRERARRRLLEKKIVRAHARPRHTRRIHESTPTIRNMQGVGRGFTRALKKSNKAAERGTGGCTLWLAFSFGSFEAATVAFSFGSSTDALRPRTARLLLEGFGFRVQGQGFRVQVLFGGEIGVWVDDLRVPGFGFRGSGLGFGVQGGGAVREGFREGLTREKRGGRKGVGLTWEPRAR